MNINITYAKESKESAVKLETALRELGVEAYAIKQVGGKLSGDVNWGRNKADTLLNPDISNSTNKRVMRELFREHGVPMPKLVSARGAYTRSYFANGETLIGRPDKHTRGRGFWRVSTWTQYLRAMRGTKKKRAATHFMEEIKGANHEYRVHIFKGKSIRISEKNFTGEPTPGKPNHREYTTIKPTGNTRAARQAAKAAMAATGLDFGAVDCLADDNNRAWVLEVNAAPGLGGSMPRVYAEAIKKWKESL